MSYHLPFFHHEKMAVQVRAQAIYPGLCDSVDWWLNAERLATSPDGKVFVHFPFVGESSPVILRYEDWRTQEE